MSNVIDGVKSFIWSSNYHGYKDVGTKAPMVAGDSSDDGSDEEDNGTMWGHPNYGVIVGSELGANVPSSPTTAPAQHMPVLGGPFSALLQSMWPQDILGQIQQTEDSGMHPECEYDEFGFRLNQTTDKEDPDPCSYGASEDPSVRLRWTAFVESTQKGIIGDLTWDKVSLSLEKSEKLKELVYSGIPHSMRVHVWPRLSGAYHKKSEAEMSYKKVVRNSLKEDTLIGTQIDKDLCRTMPANACFCNDDSIGVPKLKRVLLSLAWFFPDIGYCQGMGMIASSLLLFLEEEDVFWMMVSIIEELLPTSYYSSTLIGVQVDQRVLRQLIASYIPRVDDLMNENDIELGLITLHWFLTAMAGVLNLKMLLRIWDLFFYEGSIILFKVTLGMIKYKEKELLSMENSAQIFNILSNLPSEMVDINMLLVHTNKAAASLTPVILQAHRNKHFAFLEAELNKREDSVNNNVKQEIQRRTSVPQRKTWISMAYDISTAVYKNSLICGSPRKPALTMKAKNVIQTEIISNLREAVFQIARHFDYKGTKAELLPDYTRNITLQDYQNVNIERIKQRRAKALIDFERHEDDELGFRKNDLIMIISQKDEHCWIGELNGLRGWFPAKFVEVLDERSKEYSSAGDDRVTGAVTDLVRGKLYNSLRRVLAHGLKSLSFSGYTHPWLYIQEASKKEVQNDFKSVYSRLVLCKTFKLDEDGKILSPDELLYRAVQRINSKYDDVRAGNDAKLRTLICHGLNEQVLHLWFELLCCMKELTEKWYDPHSYVRSPGWVQIKYELTVLSKFSFNLSLDHEIKEKEESASSMKEDVQDMLVKHHLFSWHL